MVFPKRQWFASENVLVWEIQFLKFITQMWNYWGNFEKFFFGGGGIPQLMMASLLAECKNLRISYSLSRVMSLNPSVEIGLFCGKIWPEGGFLNNAYKRKQTQYYKFLPHICFHTLAGNLVNNSCPHRNCTMYLYLTVMFVYSLLKNSSETSTISVTFFAAPWGQRLHVKLSPCPI
jgi:hypothetical protein